MELPSSGREQYGPAAGFIPGPDAAPCSEFSSNGEITAPGTVSHGDPFAQDVPAAYDAEQVRDDVAWNINAALPAVTEPAISDEVITAPTAHELAAHDALALADDESRIRYLHERLPEVVQRLVPPCDPADIPRYDLHCMDYWAIHEQAGTAVLHLNQIMAGHSYEQGSPLLRIRQSFTGRYMVADGTLVPATTTVSMHFGRDGLTDPVYGGAIQACTRTADDTAEGGVASAPDGVLPVDREIAAEYLTLPPLGTLTDALAHTIRYHSWDKGVEPWVASYMALPPPAEPLPAADDLDGIYMPLGVYQVLQCRNESPERALSALRFAFGGQHIGTGLEQLHEADPDVLTAILTRYGVTERFAWLVENAEAIHASVVAAERTALEEQFPARFNAWRDRVEAVTSEVNALCEELQHLGGQAYETIAAHYKEIEPRTHFPLGSGRAQPPEPPPRPQWRDRLWPPRRRSQGDV